MQNKAEEIVKEANKILEQSSTGGMVFTGNGYQNIDKQVRTIIRIAKYKFGWSRSALFTYILQTCPELRERLTNREIKNSKTSALYQIMNSKQKSLVIQRLDQIQKRNKSSNIQKGNQSNARNGIR
jgi:hypothetical protein